MPEGMPLPGALPRRHLPLPRPMPITVHHSAQASATQADWDLPDDEFVDDGVEAGAEDGSETSSFGTSDGTPSCSDDGGRNF